LKVVVFTTSYPRHTDDFAGRFVSDPVERLRARGLEVEVVHPGVYKDYGVAYQGGGIMHAVRRRPWIARGGQRSSARSPATTPCSWQRATGAPCGGSGTVSSGSRAGTDGF